MGFRFLRTCCLIVPWYFGVSVSFHKLFRASRWLKLLMQLSEGPCAGPLAAGEKGGSRCNSCCMVLMDLRKRMRAECFLDGPQAVNLKKLQFY
jgi:hypothetical protein